MDDRATRAAIRIDIALRVILCARKERQLLGVRNRPADRSARIHIAVVRAPKAVVIRQPVVGIQLVGARIRVQRSVILVRARLRHTRNHHRPIRLVRAEVRRLHLHLAHKRVVDIHQCRPKASGIRQTRAVQLQGDARHRRAIRRIRCRLAYFHLRKVRRGIRRRQVADRESRQNALQLGRIASHHREPVQVIGGDRRTELPAVQRQPRHRCAHRNALVHIPHIELQIRQRQVVPRVQVNRRPDQLIEPGMLHRQFVVAAGDRREGERSRTVALRSSQRPTGRVPDRHRGARNNRSRLVLHHTAQRRGAYLAPRRIAQHGQQHHQAGGKTEDAAAPPHVPGASCVNLYKISLHIASKICSSSVETGATLMKNYGQLQVSPGYRFHPCHCLGPCGKVQTLIPIRITKTLENHLLVRDEDLRRTV